MVQRYLLICALAFGVSAFCATAADAWGGGEVGYQQGTTDYATYSAEVQAAQPQMTIQFVGQDEQLHTASAQVTIGKSVRLAYVPIAASWMISLGADTAYHHFGYSGQYSLTPVLIASTNKMVLPLPGNGSNGYFLTFSDDIAKDTAPVFGLRGQIVGYNVQYDSTRAFLAYQDSEGISQKAVVYSQVFSRNKRFGVFWLSWKNYVRVDFKTGEIRVFLQRYGTWHDGIYASRASAITNDGRYVFMNDGTSVVDVQSTCGLVINPDMYNGTIDQSYMQCPERQLDPSAVTGYDAWHQMSYLAPNERSFSYWLAPYPYTTGGTQEPRKVTVVIDSKHEGVDYLALGDSYSSGEGDIEKNAHGANFYLPLTDISNDTCHVSSRSYPFLLRDYWGIDEANMKSVACSGAQVVFDYYRPLNGYLGQNDRLKGRQDIPVAQQNAIDKFIPGRVPQLEFVKKYQPAVVTLTGGGNDVGFADILMYCAYGSGNVETWYKLLAEGFYGLATCSFAQSDSEAQQIVNRAIASQYQYTVRLVQSIKQASPNTQIYVIGYPSFISEGAGVCGNSLELDSQERAAIYYYLRSLNAQLSKAANDENVSFIDIEDSLKGGRLCEGSKYVTGTKDVLLSGGAAQNNMFHPNAEGHKMIAAAIESAIANGSAMDVTVPERPAFVSANMYQGTVINTPVVQGTATSQGPLPLSVEPGQFAPNTNVAVALHSDTINLGTIKTLPNGSIASTLLHGALPVGFHMLTLEGVGVDGQALLLYQFLTIDKGSAEVADGAAGNNTQAATVDHATKAPTAQTTERTVPTASPVVDLASPVATGLSATVKNNNEPTGLAQAAPSGFTLVDNRILFGLFAWLFIITTWPLIRRIHAKAKSKRQ